MASLTAFERPGTLPTPGPIGRTVRLLVGLLMLSGFVDLVPAWGAFVNPSPPSTAAIWISAALAFWYFPDLVNIPLRTAWGNRPQVVLAVMGLLAVGIDLVRQGTVYGLAAGALVYALLLWFLGFGGLSFVAAALFATPG